MQEVLATGDRVITVSGEIGFNGFANTELDRLLRERGIADILLAGLVTSLCIDSTGRAGYERGYRVTILSDCTAARTGSEQDFYCQNIFPLYGHVAEYTQCLDTFA